MLSIIKRDERLSGLIDEAQQIMGKPLTSAWRWRPSPPLYLITMVCRGFYSHGHPVLLAGPTCGMWKKTAASWVDLGIDTHEKAEQHIL